MIMACTAPKWSNQYPDCKFTWELLGYDAPATMNVTFQDGRQKHFNIEHHSKYELHNIMDKWQWEHHLRHIKEMNEEKETES